VGCFAPVLLVTAPAFWLSARANLEEALDNQLSTHIHLITLFEGAVTADELRDLSESQGINAVITTTQGDVLTTTPLTGPVVGVTASNGSFALPNLASRTVVWQDGTEITVFVSQASTQKILSDIAIQLVVISLVAFALGAFLLHRVARRALRPLGEMAVLAEQTAAGEAGLRLNPSNPTTPLGRFATLYDQVLEQLERSVARSTTAETNTREMLDNAAHQLRSPIAAVQATVDALLYEERPEVLDRLRENLFRESKRTGSLVDNLLRLAQIDQSQAIQHGYMNLGLTCRAAVEYGRALAPNLTVDDHIENGARGIWRTDDRAVREIVSNLIDNACRHAVSRVELRAELAHNGIGGIRLTVRDDGPGVPVDQREQIFERFMSYGTHQGSGLGLAVARGLARAMGGDVVCHGAEFVVEIPAVCEGPEPREPFSGMLD